MRLVVLAAAIATIVSLIGTPLLIKILARHGYAQAIRVSVEGELYPAHEGKRGTPSMGGAAIIVAVVAGYAITHLIIWRPMTPSGLLVIFLMVGLGLVGLADDYLKIFKQRSTGLRARTKLIGQAVVALAFAWLSLHFTDGGPSPASMAISFVRDTSIVLPPRTVPALGVVPRDRDHERREPHRRARRACDRCLDHDLRVLCPHLHLAVRAELLIRRRRPSDLLRHGEPPRSCRRCRSGCRSQLWVPLVEHCARPDLHG